MKPPLAKKSTSKLMAEHKSPAKKDTDETSNQGRSLKPINVFKSSLAPSGMGVTSEVTKSNKFENGSNCSDNQPLLDRKRDKKKKKKRDREEKH
jgi:hypothetical protein